LAKDKGKAVFEDYDPLPGKFPSSAPVLAAIPKAPIGNLSPAAGLSPLSTQPLPTPIHTSPYRAAPLPATHPLSAVSPLEKFPSLPEEETDSSALFTTILDPDGEDEIFMELEDLPDPAISTESSKKIKVEDGDEESSHL